MLSVEIIQEAIKDATRKNSFYNKFKDFLALV